MRISLFIFIYLMGIVLICASILGVAYVISETPYFKEKQRIRQEWREKVNACILDHNYRTDCELILYRDAQINNLRVNQEQQAAVMTSAMIGSTIGRR